MLEQQRKVAWAMAGSLGLHVLLLLLWAVVASLVPHKEEKPSRPDKPLKVTIETVPPEPTPTPTPAVVAPAPLIPFADTAGMIEQATPPPDARLQSARNTVDASELAPDGQKRGPAQRGKEASSFAVKTQEFHDAPSPASEPQTRSAPPETAPPLPRAVARNTPPPAPQATPAPVRGGTLALATPPSLPAEPEPEANPFDPSFRPPKGLTEPPHPTPVAQRDYYRPNQLKTTASGSISNLGASSVASVATPTGRYQGEVIAAIAKRWRAYTDSRMDLLRGGTVTIRFSVGMDGKARGVQVLSNTSNEALASVSLRAIMEAKIPPMPSDAVPKTDGGQLPIDLPFEILEAQQ